jgi:hypothetical protein
MEIGLGSYRTVRSYVISGCSSLPSSGDSSYCCCYTIAFLRGVILYTMHQVIEKCLGLLDLWKHLHIFRLYPLKPRHISELPPPVLVSTWQPTRREPWVRISCPSANLLARSCKVARLNYLYQRAESWNLNKVIYGRYLIQIDGACRIGCLDSANNYIEARYMSI